MRKNLKGLIPAAMLALGGLAGGAAAQDTVKIGAVLTITGPAAFLGEPERKVFEHYSRKINEAGGVLGKPIEMIIYDSGGDTARAVSFTRRLISNDQVDVLIGGSTTSDSLAMLPVAEQSEMPFIALGGSSRISDPVRPHTFAVVHTDRMAAQKIFEEMQANGITRIGMLSENVGYGASGHEEALKFAGDYGIEVVAEEFYGPRDADVTAQLTRIRNTEGVEAILTWGIGQTAAVVVRNYDQLGLTQQLYHTHGVVSDSFLELAGSAAEGLRLPASSMVVAEQLPDDDPQRDVLLEFKNEYESTFNEGVSTYAGHAYDSLMIVVQAIERAGSLDKAAVRDEIENTRGFVGTAGVFNYAPDDHLGLDLDAFKMLEVQNGRWVLSE